MSESKDQKAGRYLAEGRVAALHVNRREHTGQFRIAGSSDEPYDVFYRSGDWTCTCPARVLDCVHILACQKISDFSPYRSFSIGGKITY